MRLLGWIFGLATAHRMMITFNCEGKYQLFGDNRSAVFWSDDPKDLKLRLPCPIYLGLSGFGRAVQNVPDECSDAIFYQAPIRLQQVKQLSKTNEAKRFKLKCIKSKCMKFPKKKHFLF